MNLSETQIDAIRSSFLLLTKQSQQAGETFYQHLFEISPEISEMFVNDVSQQATKLMSTLGLVVSQLQNWRDLQPVIEDLALRHLAYGVKRPHYDIVGAALIAMMRDCLGPAFTAEAEAAWRAAYGALAADMCAIAYAEPSPVI